MSNPDHILIVDDDRDIRTLLADYLEKQGLRCTTATDGREMRAVLESHRIDLIVLDIMMPGEDGLTLCRNLRASGDNKANIPVLMLTARGEDMDRIIGLEMGADDYLPKPFVPRELYARVRAILRRARALPPNMSAAPNTHARELHFTNWRLDTIARHLIDRDGTIVALSGAEFRMLNVFLAHPQRILSRDQLMELTQGREADVFDRSIDLLISRLRQRLNDNAREPAIIKTVRNEGYVLACEVTPVGVAP
ncbi:DNA-binding response regulator [Betaproteobacteria bacterium]|nr:DNA-binding response regulator [Betaproteobacteria bacterium]GHT91930.1 DNA-binding response regulator [Betaproteobacteria bacterium]GHU02811.1 DNA-binding response regulator [Betaproteobacteria bacterium]GHU07978.1 DNA-binding response regulator [Betaproteobacteria bacterium]GHU19251.1 DNA-binding response regulator [Betaproteobacteria bacterium]